MKFFYDIQVNDAILYADEVISIRQRRTQRKGRCYEILLLVSKIINANCAYALKEFFLKYELIVNTFCLRPLQNQKFNLSNRTSLHIFIFKLTVYIPPIREHLYPMRAHKNLTNSHERMAVYITLHSVFLS